MISYAGLPWEKPGKQSHTFSLTADIVVIMKSIRSQELDDLSAKARREERRRAHLNVHSELDDPVQRLFIALEPETYIRPHRHAEPPRSELLVVIRGAIDAINFDDSGKVTERVRMAPGQVNAVDVPAGTWHSYVCLESGTVVFEAKQGPYTPATANNVASWSPPEGSREVDAFMETMRTAMPQG